MKFPTLVIAVCLLTAQPLDAKKCRRKITKSLPSQTVKPIAETPVQPVPTTNKNKLYRPPTQAIKPATETNPPVRYSNPPANPGLTEEEQDGLNRHNMYRARNNVEPLVWSTALAASATAYAKILAAKGCGLSHSHWPGIGENLAAIWGGEQTISQSVDAYMNEPIGPGIYNHRTQVMWSGSTHVGCGFARGYGCRVNVCHYNPPGNVIGSRAY